jgi:hypothetical protein
MKYLLTLCIASVLLLSSCNVAYRSAALNTPLFSAKNQLAIVAANNNIQAAYAVTDHVGVMANGFFEQSVISNNETGQGGTGYLGEIGAGYFTPLADPNVIFETYAGMGYGHLYLNNNYRDGSNNVQKRTLDADGIKGFIQPAIGYKLPYVEVSAALRYTVLNYTGIRTSNWPQQELVQADLNQLGTSAFHFVEPGVTLRTGFKNVKIQLQYLYCMKLNPEQIRFRSDQFIVGVFIKLPTNNDPH